MERNIHMTVAYDGTNYHGFQRQSNAMTVQQVLEERLSIIFGHQIKINGSARTDTGVHAYGQSVNFRTVGSIQVARIVAAAKSVLPNDIVIVSARTVPESFHARFDAKRKTYVYKLRYCRVKDPFLRNYAWQLEETLDLASMNIAAQVICGKHDFSSFRASGSSTQNPVREVYKSGFTMKGELMEFEIEGNGFLYHMVRNIVGTLVDVGRGKISCDDFAEILAARNRKLAGKTAPACGLYLKSVEF